MSLRDTIGIRKACHGGRPGRHEAIPHGMSTPSLVFQFWSADGAWLRRIRLPTAAMVHVYLLRVEFGLHEDGHPASVHAHPHPWIRAQNQLRRPRDRRCMQHLGSGVPPHPMHTSPSNMGSERPGLVSPESRYRFVELASAYCYRFRHFCAAHTSSLVVEDGAKSENQCHCSVRRRLLVRGASPLPNAPTDR